MPDSDQSAALCEAVRTARAEQRQIGIESAGSKQAIGVAGEAGALSVLSHCGVIEYEPTELVISARAGTPLETLTALLEEHGQMLPFEPPQFPGATLGGTIATGLSGPRRPFAGAARDFVLGIRLINGRGEDLRFGGKVMKNVAGYDISRLQVGAFGTLGLLLDVSMKVLPRPAQELTLHHELPIAGDLSGLLRLCRSTWPVSAVMLNGNQQFVRYSGSATAIEAVRAALGGEIVEDPPWSALRDHRLPFFHNDTPLWRISLPLQAPADALDALGGACLYDWGGAQRWLKTEAPALEVFAAARRAGGHATRFSATTDALAVWQPLEGPLARLHRRIRDSFDPDRLFNPQRFHPEIEAGHEPVLPSAVRSNH